MAQIEWIEKRLREWAQWLVIGDASGYASKNTLHPEWSPPTPGTTPTMKTAPPSSARETHRAVLELSGHLQHTLHVRYCMQLSLADQAARLECQAATVDQRIWRAHKELAVVLKEAVLRNMESR